MATTYANLLPPLCVAWAFASTAIAMLPHSTRFSIWLMLAFVVMGTWRVLGAFGLVRLPDRKYLSIWLMKQFFAIAIFVATYISFDGQLGRDAGVAMLTALLGLKLLEMRTPRDFYIVMFLAYFLVVTNLFYSQTLLTAGYMVVVVVVVTAGLIYFNGERGGLKFRESFKFSIQYCLQAVPIMVIAFVLFPRIPGPLWGVPQNTTEGVTGLSDEMTIGNISRLSVSDEIAFRVEFVGDEPPARELYWRGPVFWQTDGVTWRGGQKNISKTQTLKIDRPNLALANEGGQYKRYDYQIIIEPHGEQWVFALDHARSSEPRLKITFDHQALAPKSINRRARYELTSIAGGASKTINNAERDAALAIPQGYHRRTVALGERWRTELTSAQQIITTALTHFNQQNFIYTLTPKALSNDAVDSFLFETREGFCEYYATSFVILMRAAGIPARVVTGYQGGEYNVLSDFMLIRQRDAHAWAEVFLEDQGWVRVDPTAAVAPERVSLGLSEVFPSRSGLGNLDSNNPFVFTWNRVHDMWDAVNFNWSRWVLGYSPQQQRQLLDNLGLEKWNYGTLIMALTLVSALAISMLALLILRTRSDNPDQVIVLYEKFCRKLAKAGFLRAPFEGPLDFARRVADKDQTLGIEVEKITQLYIGLRYTNNDNDVGSFANSVRQFGNRK